MKVKKCCLKALLWDLAVDDDGVVAGEKAGLVTQMGRQLPAGSFCMRKVV